MAEYSFFSPFREVTFRGLPSGVFDKSKSVVEHRPVMTRRRVGRSGFESRQGKHFLFSTMCRPVLGPTERFYLIGNKARGIWSYHSPPFSMDEENTWSYASIPPYACTAWYLVRYQGYLSFSTFITPAKLPDILKYNVILFPKSYQLTILDHFHISFVGV